MTIGAPLQLYNSLTRKLETFQPIDPALVRVYTCGPTVYNYQHIGNMRAFLFADTLGRVLRWKGYNLKHIINITDVGHLTSDADAGDDKMEKAAAAQHKSIWEIAAHYTEAFKADIARLNIMPPAEWTVATDHIPQMIAFAQKIEQDCYEIEGGLYFDTSKVPNYGSLARAATDEGESRIDPVSGKRNPADFAIWRKSPPGEQRQMEWDSPWGKGAPGWHLECSVMSLQHLGHPFDIHTGGIDHREIHHPNEIAQNQAFCSCDDTGARIWMHNNFLIDRGGKMSKSTGEFLKLQVLIDRGVHPLAYRLMCLQAHYRSEVQFTWEGLGAAVSRIDKLWSLMERLRATAPSLTRWTYNKQRRYDSFRIADITDSSVVQRFIQDIDIALSHDLNTAQALVVLEEFLWNRSISEPMRVVGACLADSALGLGLRSLTRQPARRKHRKPVRTRITKSIIDDILTERNEARAEKDFARSDAIRDELTTAGVEVMDGDPLGWDWRLNL